ncbi:tRNA lysidine(34) synthetase TilS [Ostreiculturibacter nitratireducens]|uniref:tRNA lysidine(34) synthetase TilS n=1 Tax=Ostreiculturibacter nitratireducens TaxID=3075226 RepID=UPI0031B5A4F0
MSDAELLQTIVEFLAPRRIFRLGVAVSGGGDSTALLHLLAAWAGEHGAEIAAVTVDHGLRPGSAAEAAAVARICAGLGVPHETLRWHWDGEGNLQDQARRARLTLIADWARGRGIGAVALGHTRDDQAETFLMRLARGAGVDGLSGMSPERHAEGIQWLRPLLTRSRAELRDWLAGSGLAWFDDPSNENPDFDRVKARRAIGLLAPLGVEVEDLAAAAGRLSVARAALAEFAARTAAQIVRVEAGDVVFEREGFVSVPRETQLRLLSHALRWVASAEYGPRFAPLEESLEAVAEPARRVLHGCLISSNKREVRVTREYQAVRDLSCKPGDTWDGRWMVRGEEAPGLDVRALGETGLRDCQNWREVGIPRTTLISTPSVWREDKLIAAPLAGKPEGWVAELTGGKEQFLASLTAA